MPTFNFNPTTTRYEPANAYWLGQAAKLAYTDGPTIQEETATWGFDKFYFFDRRETQGFIIANDKLIIIAFRGTEPKKLLDWVSDADLDMVDFPGGKAHHGFVRALSRVWADILAKLTEFQDNGQSLWVTGHSLGAALATLATARFRLEQDKPVYGLYTFGQPRVGDRRLAQLFDFDFKSRAFRFGQQQRHRNPRTAP